HHLEVEESLKARAVELRAIDEVGDEIVEQRRRERDVRIAQQADEVVGAGAEERVLKIDDAQARRTVDVLHHQVAALVVAMDEAARVGGELLGDRAEDALELFALGGRGREVLRLHAVLAKMIELPLEEVVVETTREGDALGIGMRGGEALEGDELIDRLAV